MQPAPDIALMVLNWNGADLMRKHLPAVVEAAEDAGPSARVYVIDNASEDDSRALLAAAFPQVSVIALDRNLRLHAYNQAVRSVPCEAFVMLNNDLSPAAGSIDALWAALSADPSVFAVGGEVVDVDSGEIDSGATRLRWERGAWTLHAHEPIAGEGPQPVAYVSGGAGLYRRDMFLELEGFWDALPGLYWEDVELCLHAWLHGWRSLFVADARFDHASGSTVRRALNPRVREFRTFQNVRLIHLEVLLDPADLREYVIAELRRGLRKPYLYPALLTLASRIPRVRARRRRLAQLGRPSARELQSGWGADGDLGDASR